MAYRVLLFLYSSILGYCLISCNSENRDPSAPNNELTKNEYFIPYTLTAVHSHDTSMFTEGLFIKDGLFFESSGAPDYLPKAKSVIGILDIYSGKVNIKFELNSKAYFGEGIAVLNDRIFMLTYKNKIGFVIDPKTFKQIKTFPFTNEEGWGLTSDENYLIMSDGTSRLSYIDPTTLKEIKQLEVRDKVGGIKNLNELEYINGFIYANIWQTNRIVKIDPQTGIVVGNIDLSDLASDALKRYSGSLEMNGIAYDQQNKKLYVTGKFWPTIYQITIPL